MFGFEGKAATAVLEDLIAGRRVSGIVLFSRNIRDARQVSALCAEMQAMRKRVSELPLLVALDHEGGTVHRLTDGATRFPAPMALAATGRVELAGRVGYSMGCELLGLGVNMVFAPVLDVNTNKNNPVIGVRAFSDDPETVAAFGTAMITGLERAGIASVAKHFPGLGFAEQDPHVELPVISKDAEELDRQDILPFARAVKAGVSGVMVGHARYPALSARPASLSSAVIRDLLRQRLGFEGIVLTDDLEMEAMQMHRGAGDAAVKACGAGADLLLICHSSTQQINAMADLANAISASKLRSEQIKGNLSRLRDFKEKLRARLMGPPPKPAEDGDALAREVAESALTLVGDSGSILPLRLEPSQKLLLLSPETGPLTPIEDNVSSLDRLAEILRARHPRAETLSFPIVPSRHDFEEVRRALGDAAAVVMCTCNAHLYPEQAKLLDEVAASGRPAVFVAIRNPYDAELYPSHAARLVAYGADRHTLAAVGKALFGDLAPRGKCPVALKA
ncbi:MAG: beta-N-acetylhexosaminidase [Chlamydiota bacterium]